MASILWFLTGLVLGALLHAYLTPRIVKAWVWFKAEISRPRE
jgi:hypothetical protein